MKNRIAIAVAMTAASLISLSACSSKSDESGVKTVADGIAVACFTEVQPINFPRISSTEEQRINDCAFAAADELEDPLGDLVSNYLLYESDLLPDGN